MTGQQFYEYYCQKINNAKTSWELRDIQNEIFEFSMKSCANGTFKEYRSYVEQLYIVPNIEDNYYELRQRYYLIVVFYLN